MLGSAKAMELEKISLEMNQLSLKRQHLNDRRNMLNILQQFKNSSTYIGRTGDSSEQSEIYSIDKELEQLSGSKRELHERQDKILANDQRKTSDLIISQPGLAVLPDIHDSPVIFIEAPPSTPAPKVILDIQKLPPFPSQTQCPECRQFITTETVTSVGHVTCLVCLMMSMCGCVAGCCLIPFCVDNWKDVTHRCPKCRSSFHTIKKL